MTYQSPRIYTYKITFEEVPYYYYGVHKEKKFDEEYWGTPITHKWMWDFYTPKKQILEIFDFGDEGWIKAQEVETRLIRPFYNNDEWCLNEKCGLKFSIEVSRKVGKKAKELKTGIFAICREEHLQNCIKAGKITGLKHKENKTGVCGRSKEKIIEDSRKGGKIGGKIACKNTNFQKWECLETGFITNPGNLTQYQKRRGIDTSKNNRRRIA
jgi:hypothetical protein